MSITETEITHALSVWRAALLGISKAFEDGGIEAARAVAGDALDAAYGYNLGPVLFKPTLASGEQTFRTTRAGALAYFTGHSDEYPLDAGFAIRKWREVKFQTAASFIEGDAAMWMGHSTFTEADGTITEANKSFGYKKDAEGTLRIVLHHSSLPFQP